MDTPQTRQKPQAKPRFPWLILLLLIAAIVVFWVVPAKSGPRHISVRYEDAPRP